MRVRTWAAYVTGVIVVVLSAVTGAQAQDVTFSGINDAVPGKFFDAATSVPDALNANKLIIGFNSGFDPATWTYTDFRASTASFNTTAAMDTISFIVEAPAGYYVSRITYSQRGTGSVVRTGKASGGASWVVADNALNVRTFGTNPTLSFVADLAGLNLTAVPVSITDGLFAFATPTSGSASLSVTGADVVVEVLPLGQ